LLDAVQRELLKLCLLLARCRRVDASVVRRSELSGQLAVVLAGILAGPRRDLGGEEVHDGPVFVRGPNCAIEAEKARAGAFFAAEATRSIQEALDEPLESDGNLDEPAAELPHYFVDDAATDHGLPY